MATGVFEQLNVLEKLITVVAAGGLAFTTFSANSLKNQLDEVSARQQISIELRKDERENSKQANELTKIIFDEFVAAIKDDGDVQQRIDRLNAVLVLTYAIPDPRQQEGMAMAVKRSMERITPPADQAVAKQLAAAKFDADELVARASGEQRESLVPASAAPRSEVAKWSNYDFDVFYCDGLPDTELLQRQANEVAGLKGVDASASGRWRVRPLPVSVNQRAGYQVKGNEIRYSSADEKVLADELQQLMQKRLGVHVVTRLSSQQTPWYLSVFLCPEP